MRHAILTGSFDPVTAGHEDLILRAASLFDQVTVAILANTEKAGGAFSPGDRLHLMEMTLAALPCRNVTAVVYGGLTSDLAHETGARFIVRGARSAIDFDYEYELSLIMKRFDPDLETVILPAAPSLSMISSTYVRDLLRYDCDLAGAVPESCREEMLRLYRPKER